MPCSQLQYAFSGLVLDLLSRQIDYLHQGSQMYSIEKIADFSHFKPILAKWLHQKAS